MNGIITISATVLVTLFVVLLFMFARDITYGDIIDWFVL